MPIESPAAKPGFSPLFYRSLSRTGRLRRQRQSSRAARGRSRLASWSLLHGERNGTVLRRNRLAALKPQRPSIVQPYPCLVVQPQRHLPMPHAAAALGLLLMPAGNLLELPSRGIGRDRHDTLCHCSRELRRNQRPIAVSPRTTPLGSSCLGTPVRTSNSSTCSALASASSCLSNRLSALILTTAPDHPGDAVRAARKCLTHFRWAEVSAKASGSPRRLRASPDRGPQVGICRNRDTTDLNISPWPS
jgi:hypothetical protein